MRVGRCFVKRDWGSGRATWRERTNWRMDGCFAVRRLSNRRAKKAWLNGTDIKAY